MKLKFLRLKSAPLLFLAVVSALSLTSCGSAGDEGSADLEMDVLDGGLLLPVENQTCADKADGDGARSAKAVSLNFGAIRLKWIPPNRNLYIGLIKITVRSSRIAGGMQEFTLPSDEIELLLGAAGQVITPDTTNGNKAIVSNKLTNRAGAPACGLTIGGVTLSGTSTTSFTANVTIDLLGQSSGSDDLPDGASDGSNPKVIRKSYTTTATYY